MSLDLEMEEGKIEKLPIKVTADSDDLRSSAPQSLIGFISYCFLVTVSDIVYGIVFLIAELLKCVIKKEVFLALCVIAIILDPLFFYIPVIHDEKKCVKFDQPLTIISTILRSVFDFLKIIHIISRLLHKLREARKGFEQGPFDGISHELKEKKGKPSFQKRLWFFFLVDILAILPIPQVLVNVREIKETKFFFLMTYFFLFQYLVRIMRGYFLVTKATGVTGILAEATWAIVAFNLLLYMQGSHVFGSLWYSYAVHKVTLCWKRACFNHTGCIHNSFNCDANSGDYSFINDFCQLEIENKAKYEFGLYTDAVQSGVVRETNFAKKLLHCLQWGLQNLSAFGQNLQTTMDVWENIFAICMTSFGVILFVFLIGKMQSDTARSRKIKQKWQEIKHWSNFEKIHSDTRGQLRNYKRQKWQEIKRVDVENLVNDLPEDVGKKIRREFCLELLKNAKEFENFSEKSLGIFCDYMKPVFFMERTRIVREGDPIDEMLFVLKGKLWTYTSASRNITTVSHLIDHRDPENHLEDGDFIGQELITWSQNECSSNLPVSTRTIQALTKVEAFALMAGDLKHVLSLVGHRAALFLQCYWRFKRNLHGRKKPPPKSISRSLWDKNMVKIHSKLRRLDLG